MTRPPLPPDALARLRTAIRGTSDRTIRRMFEPRVATTTVLRAAAGLGLEPATHIAINEQMERLRRTGWAP
jgi:hypothetical protein